MTQRTTSYLAVIWSFIILIIVFIPGDKIPNHGDWMDVFQVDKAIHFLLFAPFSFLWLLKYHIADTLSSKVTYVILTIGVILAIVTEVVQFYYINGRNGNIADALADIIGIFIGLLVFKIFKRRKILNFLVRKEI
jgi:VanZ family protein